MELKELKEQGLLKQTHELSDFRVVNSDVDMRRWLRRTPRQVPGLIEPVHAGRGRVEI
jgi:hypothetical protein